MATLSTRARQCVADESPLLAQVDRMKADRFDPVKNPKGVAIMSMAENYVCEDILKDKISQFQRTPEDRATMRYTKYTGVHSLKESVQSFLTRHFNPRDKLDANNICMFKNVTTIIEVLSFALADPGDYILVPTPFYYRIKPTLYDRAKVNVITVPVSSSMGDIADRFEAVYQEAILKGKKVKGVFIVSPNNPTGEVYSEQQLQNIVNFASRHNIHAIFDEIYGLSVFDPSVTFVSCLNLRHPNPDLVHFMYGFSKDLGLPGYGGGILYTRNKDLLHYVETTGVLTWLFPLQASRLQAILDDHAWLDTVFLPSFTRNLRTRQSQVRAMFKEFGLTVWPAAATGFVFVDLAKFLPEPTFKGEQQLSDWLVGQHGVSLATGREFQGSGPGWFRIGICLDDVEHNVGVERLRKALDQLKARGKLTSASSKL